VALVPGSNAGPYRIVAPLGRGGMASVYEAYEAKLDRYVALKVLPCEFLHDPTFKERFLREAQNLAKLEHPNIVPIYSYDIEEAEGIPWMAMRLIKTGSLADLLKRERLSRARSVAILRGVADALDYAHGKGMVHRDVKPQNVLLDDAGRVYLADFGLAKMFEASGGLTASGVITGTPQYMAPEQATAARIGPPADVYALGIMAYEMLTGRVPFAADTPVAVLMKHVQEPLPLPAPDVVPETMLRALLKAASKKPEDRWPSAGALVDALAAGLGAPAAPPVRADLPTFEIPPTLKPENPPTVVSPPTPPAGAGPIPPRAERPPVLRPPVARSASPVPVGRPRAGSRFAALVVGAVGAAAFGGLVIVWLWLGRAQPPSSPPPATAAPSSQATAPPPLPEASERVRDERPPASSTARAATAASARSGLASPSPRPQSPPASTPSAPPLEAAPTPPPIAAAPAADPELERLTSSLASQDATVRRQAAQELAARGPLAAPAVPELGKALADGNADVRLRAAEALGRIGPSAQAAVPALSQALRDADTLVAGEAAKTLGLVGEPAAASALGAALGHPAVSVRREAARALARLGRHAEPALGPLVAALSDKDKTVCAQSARALGHLGPAARSALPRLTALSRDPDVLVSREAQAALDAIGREAP
jgi:serine/threonine protein kinase